MDEGNDGNAGNDGNHTASISNEEQDLPPGQKKARKRRRKGAGFHLCLSRIDDEHDQMKHASTVIILSRDTRIGNKLVLHRYPLIFCLIFKRRVLS